LPLAAGFAIAATFRAPRDFFKTWRDFFARDLAMDHI